MNRKPSVTQNPTIPDTMLTIVVPTPGGPEALQPVKRSTPRPGYGEVLIKVAAAGVNGADLTQRRGKYAVPKGAPDVLGLEVSGEIVAVGDGVDDIHVGDSVCALLIGGGYAEYCVVPAPQCLPIPAGLTVVQAAALPEVAMTVWSNVFELGGLKPGETFLVHGGTSGIGTFAIQLANRLGSRVIATAGSDEKCRRCLMLGAAGAINYKNEDFVAAARKMTADVGVDLILDMVGGDYIGRNYEAAAVEGRIVQIAFQGGPKAEVNFMRMMLKRLHHTGSTLRSRSVADKAAIARAVEDNALPMIAKGKVKPVIYKTFPLKEAAAAHALMETSSHIGKIVLTL